jgi:hypothetical protein
MATFLYDHRQLLHHHNNKPFIRGGDFDRRKATGERVMQLQYSRAFGGKDLKPFGLSADPSVRQVALTQDMVSVYMCRCVVGLCVRGCG